VVGLFSYSSRLELRDLTFVPIAALEVRQVKLGP
jgi:hypothetical protein